MPNHGLPRKTTELGAEEKTSSQADTSRRAGRTTQPAPCRPVRQAGAGTCIPDDILMSSRKGLCMTSGQYHSYCMKKALHVKAGFVIGSGHWQVMLTVASPDMET